MIKLTILGNIGKDAEIKHFEGQEKSVVNFSVAHTETFVKNGVKEQSTTWTECAWWLKKETAIKTAAYLKKGKKVYVEGQPSARGYVDAQNAAKASLMVNVFKLEFADPPQTQQAQQQPTQQQAAPQQHASYAPPIDMNNPPEDDDLPF